MRKSLIIGAVAGVVIIAALLFSFGGSLVTGGPSAPDAMHADTTSSMAGPQHIVRTTGPFFINATVANHSSTLPVYRGILREGESVNKRFQDSRPRQNVTTPDEASQVAKKVLEPYGGLPPDAVSNGAYTQYSRVYNYTLGQYVSEKPMSTTISYSQKMINGLWTIGDTNYICVELGENGELLRIVKKWRNYTYTGDVPIISLDTAIDKLDQHDLIESEWHPEAGDVTIDLISPGYYAKEISKNETILEPLWMFYGGNTSSGGLLGFYVYARQFANFTESPESGRVPLNVTFTDSSDATPVKWYWDFGDGTNTTVRNPVHTYEKAGTYNVTLKVWNDLGSDSLTKPVQVIP
jgi:hypothetical protein